MTRREQLVFCKKCVHRKLDMQQGMLCSITNKKANFTVKCSDYQLDNSLEKNTEPVAPITIGSLSSPIPNKVLRQLKLEENYFMALLAGIAVGVIGALLWAVITIATNYQIGYMAIAIGAGVGYTVRYFGKGISQIFGITGAIIAILSCALGNFFSIIGYTAKYETRTYLETLTLFDYSQLIPLMSKTYSYIDILFYGFAAYEGYKFAFRVITEKEITNLTHH